MRILLAFLALAVAAACSASSDAGPSDPVSRLLATRYMKATDQLGSHRVKSQLDVRAEGAAGTERETFLEELLVDERGGYRVIRREHKGSAPWELVVVGSSYYVISPEGSVETLQPGMLGQTTRERVGEAWRTVLEPFADSLVLTRTGHGDYQGRPSQNYAIEFANNPTRNEKTGILPMSGLGKLTMDDETGFPLQVEFKGTYSKTTGDRPPVKVNVKEFAFTVTDFGKIKPVRPPASSKSKAKAENVPKKSPRKKKRKKSR